MNWSKGILWTLRLVVLLIIASYALPVLIWRVSPGPDSGVTVLGSVEPPSLWLFNNRKYSDIVRTSSWEELGKQNRGNFFIVSDISSRINDEEQARLMADQIKNQAAGSGTVFFEGAALLETHGTLYRREIESFLNIKNSLWSVLYNRSGHREPELILSGSGGENIILKSGIDFSGKPPVTEIYRDRSEVYGWIPLYLPLEDTEALGTIDFHLTNAGAEKFRSAGLPVEFSPAFRYTSDLTDRWFFSIPIRLDDAAPGRSSLSFKEWFNRRIAFFRPGSSEKLYWKNFIPFLSNAISEQDSAVRENRTASYRFKAEGRQFFLESDGRSEALFIKGVNLGASLPGKWFTQFPENEELYYRWFSHIKDTGLNTLRIYTLFPPSFYRAFSLFNRNNLQDPLFLIQEIWPEEHPPGNDLLSREYQANYEKEIELTVDAVHGNRFIPKREGRAWGDYRNDVSPWLLAFLIGRELEPDEVLETDRLNEGYRFSGRYISCESGSPSESWIASACDYTARYEYEKYGSLRPLGIVSWPTLDPIRHPVEWNDPELAGREPFNDKAQIDINNLTVSEYFEPGLFGAYHIYPNYPDFMNNQNSYTGYKDSRGVFRYGGYLQEFIKGHSRYPALVAEYGISTSLATAHFNPDGLHHGGLSEKDQADAIIRMTDAIEKEGYSGAIIFEWIDEWAKKTWTTEPFMIPYDRQANWHNILDPEQNYGLVAMKAGSAYTSPVYKDPLSLLEARTMADESYLYIEFSNIPEKFKKGSRLVIGIDSYDRNRGSRKFPGREFPEAQSGMEFILPIAVNPENDPGVSYLLAADSYNIGLNRYSASGQADQLFSSVKMLVNRSFLDEKGKLNDPLYTDLGKLPHGDFSESGHCIWIDASNMKVRIPWSMLNVSDPSGAKVLDDNQILHAYPPRDTLKVTESREIQIFGFFEQNDSGDLLIFPGNDKGFSGKIAYNWKKWNTPVYREEEKKSISILKRYFTEGR